MAQSCLLQEEFSRRALHLNQMASFHAAVTKISEPDTGGEVKDEARLENQIGGNQAEKWSSPPASKLCQACFALTRLNSRSILNILSFQARPANCERRSYARVSDSSCPM